MKRFICIKSYPGVPVDTIQEFPNDESYIGWACWPEYWRRMEPGELSAKEKFQSAAQRLTTP